MTVRKGAFWHDGTPVTPEDVVWSLERAGDPKSGNPIQFVWGKIGNFKIDGDVITADVKEFEPTLFKWMAFLTGYVLPKKAYTAAGAEGFEAKPIGSRTLHGREVRAQRVTSGCKAFPKYWGPKPAFETVVFKLVPDATSRSAEVESGASDLTLEAAVRGVRPAHQEAQSHRRGAPGVGHRHDLHHQPRRRCWTRTCVWR